MNPQHHLNPQHPVVWVLGGTTEGREVVAALSASGFRVLATAVTGYGCDLLGQAGAAELRAGAMDQQGMEEFIGREGVCAVIDATHPYAEEVSRNARNACQRSGIQYLCFERGSSPLGQNPLVRRAKGYEEAARLAADLGEVIFLTTGSKTLRTFVEAARAKGRRVVARVLPQPGVVDHCIGLGLTPRDIVAMQGPFSRELNRALFQEYGASVVVTKDSGEAGGVSAKVGAALDLNLPVVVIDRPESGGERATVVRSPGELPGLLNGMGIRV